MAPELIGCKVTDTRIGRTGTLIAVDDQLHVTVQWHDRARFITTVKVEPGRYTLEVKP